MTWNERLARLGLKTIIEYGYARIELHGVTVGSTNAVRSQIGGQRLYRVRSPMPGLEHGYPTLDMCASALEQAALAWLEPHFSSLRSGEGDREAVEG